MIGKAGLGFALFLSWECNRKEIYRDKGPLPQWRGCPLAYRLHAAVYPFEGAGIKHTVAIVSSYPFGFEGPDRRFLAVPVVRHEN